MNMNSLQKMIRKACCLLVALSAGCWFAGPASAQMQSENFQINTSVVSGGGTPPLSSASFRLNSTSAQPTPLMDPDDPPESTNYALSPGFWYTLGAMPAVCDDAGTFAASFGSMAGDGNYNPACDSEGDGDVDGRDLAVFAASI
ncbi:MAG: hypothetical protein KQH63_02250 [Desulfobulbaceae bacterium]|nr:hypothetical protein [Desulfobulbaceae bacterium]